MKNELITASLLLAFTSPAFAAQQQSRPEKCPSLSAIHIEQSDIKGPNSHMGYFVVINSRFDTKDMWKFFMLGLNAQTRDAAYEEAIKILTTADHVWGPQRGFEGDDDIFTCEYSVKSTFIMAITRDYPES